MQNITTPQQPPIKTETFLERLQQEFSQLDDRIEKLDTFLKSEKVNTIDSMQISLLAMQIHVMRAYKQILAQRIALL